MEQASTIVIVDRKLRSTNLVGYVSTLAIEQAVVDAMRASGGIFVHSPYLAKVNATTGVLDTNWRPSIPKPVRALAYRNNVLYFGGDFGKVGTAERIEVRAHGRRPDQQRRRRARGSGQPASPRNRADAR